MNKSYWIGFYMYDNDEDYFYTVESDGTTLIPQIGDFVFINDKSYRVKDRSIDYDTKSFIEVGIQVSEIKRTKRDRAPAK